MRIKRLAKIIFFPLWQCVVAYVGMMRNALENSRLAYRGNRKPLAYLRSWSPRVPVPAQVSPLMPEDGRIHVLLAMHWLDVGGAEKFAIDIAKRLDQRTFAFHIITDVPAAHHWKNHLHACVEEVVHLDEELEDMAQAPYFLEDLIASRRISILHIHHCAAAYGSLVHLRRRFPALKVLDSLHIIELPPHSGGYPELSANHYTSFVDRHHVVSDHLERFLVERWRINPSKIQRIYLNVNTNYFDPEAIPPKVWRKEYGLDETCLVVGFIGRFCPQKRPFLFLTMAGLIAQRWEQERRSPKLVFAMAGNGPHLKATQNMALKLGLPVVFTGSLADPRSFYRDLDVLAMPSENEGIALVAYEVAAMGKPVILTDVGGHDEVFEADWLVDPAAHVEENMATKIHRLLVDQDLRKKIGDRNRRHMVNHHHDEQTFAELGSLYNELLVPKAACLV